MTASFVRRLFDRLAGRRAVAARSWICPTCGETHDDLPAVVASAPLVWEQASEQERAEDFDLTTDTCIWKDEHYFIRGVLEVPLTDRDGVLSFGVWTSLSRDSFFRYLPTFEEENEADRIELPPMFGWFANSLPGYPETLNLKCSVHARTGGLRPLIELEQVDHPLSIAQRAGIPFGRAVEYVHAHLGI
ncbi:DUF2199 domain-containing protein [Brevundimonas sp.]|jgi:hypothetical protein|uniref:DUF2199 domain-containing protein n=1 Tax=Brevundimonas sp. TaxID=1871086 RepID=UPI0037C185B2